MRLTDREIAQFHTEGYLFFPEVFSPEEVAVLRREGEDIYRSDRPEVWREKTGAPKLSTSRE